MKHVARLTSVAVLFIIMSGCALFQLPHTTEVPIVEVAPADLDWFRNAVTMNGNTVVGNDDAHVYRIKDRFGDYFKASPSKEFPGAYRVTDLQTKLTHIAAPSDTQPEKFLIIYETDGVRLNATSPIYVRPEREEVALIREVEEQEPVFVAPQAVQEPFVEEKEFTTRDISNIRKKSSVSPTRNRNSVFEFTFKEGIIYRIATAIRRITTIFLEPGEVINGTPIVGDPENFLADSAVIEKNGKIQHIIVLSPKHAGGDYRTNMFIPTNRRYYLLDLIANQNKFLPAVKWVYPDAFIQQMREQLKQRQQQGEPEPTQQKELTVDMANIYTGYSTKTKGNPGWVPVGIFDDGNNTYIDFPSNMTNREMPVFFLKSGNKVQLTNYATAHGRNNATRFIVHRLFNEAELRLITDKKRTVTISRDEAL